MTSVRLSVVVLITFILMGGAVPSLCTTGRQTQAGEPSASIQGQDQAFYNYHNVYHRSELPNYYPLDQSTTEKQKTIIGGGVNQKNSADESSQIPSMGPLDSPWPMMSHDVYHTGRSPYNTTQPPEGVEIWRFDASDSFEGGAVIDRDGILYFGGYDHYLYGVYPNGSLKWKTKLGGAIDSTPAIDENGIIYIGTIWDSPGLFALYSNNGTVKWSYPTGNHIDSSPAIATNGITYFGDYNGYLNALYPDGTLKWRYHTGDVITGSPAIGPDGTVYVGSQDHNLYAIYPNNGIPKWIFPTGDCVRVSPAVADDGTIYCVSFTNYLYAINPGGTMKWKTFVNAGTNPTIGPDGTIYAGWEILHAINPVDGHVKWNYTVNGYIEGGTPCTSKEGIIYFGTTSDKIIALNPDGMLRWQQDLTHPCQSPPAIAADGTIYIGSESPGAAIHAFGHGPLHIEIYGPYEGCATVPIQFIGDIFGGVPPYTCHWDFGDNQSSNKQNPKHAYAHYGVYTATFTVTDSQGNHSTDTATVAVHYSPPVVRFIKPVNGTYFMNKMIGPFPGILIFGPITITVEASQEQFGINRVDFWLDNSRHLATIKTPPYSYTWRSLAFFKHFILIQAFDNSGNSTYAGIYVWKFF